MVARFCYYGLWYHPDLTRARRFIYISLHLPWALRLLLSEYLLDPAQRWLAWANPAPIAR